MRRVHLALALAVLMPVAARAEPVSVTVQSSSGGFSQSGTIGITSAGTIDLGTVSLPGTNAVGLVLVSGLQVWENYAASFLLEGLGGFNTLRIEVLDPLDGDDGLDPSSQPSYVPAGYSTSNDSDGFSFAQDAGLERSAKWAGGSATVTANEKTNSGDILLFSGLSAADSALVRFGLRDSAGDRGFLLRITALDPVARALPNPEPASMALMGSGLVGLVGMFRRRIRAGFSRNSGTV